MRIYSGDVDCGEIGVEVRPGLHTGDIILLRHGSHIGTDNETWDWTDSLSAVVTDLETGEHYPMGIRSCGFDHREWDVVIVKKWNHVVTGEHWPAYGFNYR